MPPYVKIVLANEFPRSHITTHLTQSAGLYFGPFRSRASAERFESQFLDLFQMRRCQEDLRPTPDHPGCIYGEMGMCLRPCQQVVGAAEYGHEVARVTEFLSTGGHSLLDAIAHSRDRLSEEMQFEEAARQHKRYEKVLEALKLRDDLACDVDHLNGVAIARSAAPDAVEMWFVRDGAWQRQQRFGFEVHEGKPVSLDRQLRETFAAVESRKLTQRERREYLALLARWYYSTWRDGEWVGFESWEEIPYRKLVHAVSRAAHGETTDRRRKAIVCPTAIIVLMQIPVTVVILAAGLGTRMKSRRAKVLHRAGGKALVEHVVDTALQVAPAERIFVVVGHQAEEVRKAVATPGIGFIEQKEQKGTGHAVAMGRSQLADPMATCWRSTAIRLCCARKPCGG